MSSGASTNAEGRYVPRSAASRLALSMSLAMMWTRPNRSSARRAEDRFGRVHIIASDIDKASLEAAERGTYRPSAFVEAPDDIRARYFSQDAPHTASATLRAIVRFERRDLLQDPSPQGLMHL